MQVPKLPFLAVNPNPSLANNTPRSVGGNSQGSLASREPNDLAHAAVSSGVADPNSRWGASASGINRFSTKAILAAATPFLTAMDGSMLSGVGVWMFVNSAFILGGAYLMATNVIQMIRDDKNLLQQITGLQSVYSSLSRPSQEDLSYYLTQVKESYNFLKQKLTEVNEALSDDVKKRAAAIQQIGSFEENLRIISADATLSSLDREDLIRDVENRISVKKSGDQIFEHFNR